ncbi:tripartite tricarboxylate transporter substrate-binding protein [Devosia algicola]|uniref:Tripartite tricarboxylate transporter substrate-binding protein n=1 Tax=Devosia algicola TaxID=3026418 RepID=A0ABY7YRA3_9HYPH|nr:tripartite tricarboxylate transporter substrate-binding protein [Devosia algicola]WDR03549.1 tripartite tricarboxylate transporter substrate-binding protein [Devosia algicola]
MVRAGANIGALSHVEMLALGQALDFAPRIVSAGGGSGVRQAILSGDVDIGDQNPSAVASLVKDGQLKALAYYGSSRSSYLPDTPTMAEQGYDTPSAMCNSGYFWIRRDTPQEIKDYWTNLLETQLMAPETKAQLEETLGVEILFVGGDDMDALADKIWKERVDIVDTFGLKVETN